MNKLSYIYFKDEYAFINRKDEVMEMQPTFAFKPYILRESFTPDELRELIQSKGGYMIRRNLITGKDEQFSVKRFSSSADYYISASFCGLVYNTNGRDVLHIDSGIQTPFTPVFTFDQLLPTSWLCSTINEALGEPCHSYTALGTMLFQTAYVDDPSGINADHYVFKGSELVAAFGIKSMDIPWLYYPENKASARGVFAVFNGDANWNGLAAKPWFSSPDLGDDGILINESTIAKADYFREELKMCVQPSDTQWAIRYKAPSCSSRSYRACAQFLTKTWDETIADPITSCAVFAGPDAIALVQAVITSAAQAHNYDFIDTCTGYLLPSLVNKALTEFDDVYTKALSEKLKAGYSLAHGAQIAWRESAANAAVEIAGEAIKRRIIDELKANVSFGNIETDEFSSIAKGVFTPPMLVVLQNSNYSAFIEQVIQLYGADIPANSSLIAPIFGPVCRERMLASVQQNIPTVTTDLVTALNNALNMAATTSFQCHEKFYVTHFHDETHSYFCTRQQEVASAGAWRFGTPRLTTVGQKLVLTMEVILSAFDALHTNHRTESEKAIRNTYEDWLEKVFPKVDGWGTPQFCGQDGDEFYKGRKKAGFNCNTNVHLWGHYENRHKDIHIGLDNSWDTFHPLKYKISCDLGSPVQVHFSGDYGTPNATYIYSRWYGDIERASLEDAIQVLLRYENSILQATQDRPVCTIDGYLQSPETTRQFFDCLWFETDILAAQLRDYKAKGVSAALYNRVSTLFYTLVSTLERSIVDRPKVYWVSQDDLRCVVGPRDPNLIPLYNLFAV